MDPQFPLTRETKKNTRKNMNSISCVFIVSSIEKQTLFSLGIRSPQASWRKVPAPHPIFRLQPVSGNYWEHLPCYGMFELWSFNMSELLPLQSPLQKFTLYESRKAFYLCGSDKNRTLYKLLTIDRTAGAQIVAREDPANYTRPQMQRRLLDIEESQVGGINRVTVAYGVVGFIRFLEGYYMIRKTESI